MKITKRNGMSEEFDRMKLERSIASAGADGKTAREVAEAVSRNVVDGTRNLRQMVVSELNARDAVLAARYENTRRISARMSDKLSRGMALVSREIANNLGLRDGDKFRVAAGSAACTLTVRAADVSELQGREMMMSTDDLRALGASNGNKLTIQRI